MHSCDRSDIMLNILATCSVVQFAVTRKLGL